MQRKLLSGEAQLGDAKCNILMAYQAAGNAHLESIPDLSHDHEKINPHALALLVVHMTSREIRSCETLQKTHQRQA